MAVDNTARGMAKKAMGSAGADMALREIVDIGLQNKYRWMINPDNQQMSLWEFAGGMWVHKGDFGSIVTDKVVSTEVMGGFRYRDADGKEHYLLRVSPDTGGTGIQGASAVLGNYVYATYIASNERGVSSVIETPELVPITVPSTGTASSTSFTVQASSSGDVLIHTMTISNTTSGTFPTRQVWKNGNGDIIFENIGDEMWSLLSTEEELLHNGASLITLDPSGTSTIELGTDLPISLGDVVTYEMYFKTPQTLATSVSGELAGTFNCNRLVIDRIATRGWVETEASIRVMSPTQVGGAKLGAGLKITGGDTLESEAFASRKFVAKTEAIMLLGYNEDGTPINDLTVCLRTDISYIHYLNANEDPKILANWTRGAYTGDSVTSWKGAGDSVGRLGDVVATVGDYTHDMVLATDKTLGTRHKLIIDNGDIFLEEV